MDPGQLLNSLLMSPAIKQAVMQKLPEMLSQILEEGGSLAGNSEHPSRVRTPEDAFSSQPDAPLALSTEVRMS